MLLNLIKLLRKHITKERSLPKSTKRGDCLSQDFHRQIEEVQFRKLSALISSVPRKYNPDHRLFHPIYKHPLVASCDQVFIDRLRKNPDALTMSFWTNHFEIKALKKYPEINNRILDFGCGTGHIDILLARKGYHIHGVDLSPIGISIANELKKQEEQEIKNRISFSLNDVTRPPPPSQKQFHSVFSFHVFEHISNPGPILNGLRQWVTQGAHLLVSVPFGNAFDDPGHVHHFWSETEAASHFADHVDVLKAEHAKNEGVIRLLCRFN